MTEIEKLAIMGFGAVIAVVGLVMLFRGKSGEGRNVLKAFGAEFELSGPAIVVFLVGAGMFLVPLLLTGRFDRERQGTGAPQAITTRAPSAEEQAAQVDEPATAAPQEEPENGAPPDQAKDGAEVEPNDDFGHATAIQIGAPVEGSLREGDSDIFSLKTPPGPGLDLSVDLRLDEAPAVVQLRIYDSGHERMVDTTPSDLGSGHATEFLAEANAEYFVELEGLQDTRYSVTVSKR
jgi:hypothetical protein